MKNGKTDYDAHCTVGVVIAFPFFRRAGAPYPQRGEGEKTPLAPDARKQLARRHGADAMQLAIVV